ncbi:MAG: hypothetical protein GY765_02895 [bacterium]|nr:hypothetical protein [bacterium]
MPKILESGKQWLDEALKKSKAGDYANCTKLLLKTAVLIITPVKKQPCHAG